MKTADIEVGAEYAYGDAYRGAERHHVKVLETRVERREGRHFGPGHLVNNGIRVEFLEGRLIGVHRTVRSATIIRPWVEQAADNEVERQAAERKADAKAATTARRVALARRIEDVRLALGIPTDEFGLWDSQTALLEAGFPSRRDDMRWRYVTATFDVGRFIDKGTVNESVVESLLGVTP